MKSLLYHFSVMFKIFAIFSDYPLRPDEENEIKAKYENMLGSQADIQVYVITFRRGQGGWGTLKRMVKVRKFPWNIFCIHFQTIKSPTVYTNNVMI